MFYSVEETLQKQIPYRVHLTVFPFYCGLWKGFWRFVSAAVVCYLESWKCLTPQGTAIEEPKVVQLFLLTFYCGVGKGFGPFVLVGVILLFEILKEFYQRDCDSRTEGGPIILTYVLSPERRCWAYPEVVPLFFLVHYLGYGRYIALLFQMR